MNRRILLSIATLLSGLALTACNSGGLNVQGSVAVTTAAGTASETTRTLPFTNATRLDGSGPGRFTGSCVLTRTRDASGAEQWGAVAEIHTGGTTTDANPLTSVTMMQNTGADPASARVEIEMGGVTYAPVAGGCSVEVPYALRDGVTQFSGTCDVANAAGDQATVTLDVDFGGCTVQH